MSQNSDNEKLIQQLLQERDEMYCELSRLRQADEGYVEALKAQNKALEAKINKQDELLHKKEEQLKALQYRTELYKRVFGSADGVKLLADLETFCCYNSTTQNEQCPNALQTSFNEGKRRVVLRIKEFLRKEDVNE